MADPTHKMNMHYAKYHQEKSQDYADLARFNTASTKKDDVIFFQEMSASSALAARVYLGIKDRDQYYS